MADQPEPTADFLARVKQYGPGKLDSPFWGNDAAWKDVKRLIAMAEQRQWWEQLAKGLERLNAAYRVGGRRSPEKALDQISEAREKLQELGAYALPDPPGADR